MATTRVPAGAARPSERVDHAVRQAVLDELTEVGYAATSMESVARRAGVGKAALYRRWPSKRDMFLAILSETASVPEALPDTGTLYGDVVAYLRDGREPLGERVRIFLTELIVTGARDHDFRADVQAQIFAPRRQLLRDLFCAAIDRGELPEDADVESAVDVLVGANYWRYTVKHQPLTDESTARLAVAVVRAAGGTPPADVPDWPRPIRPRSAAVVDPVE